MALFSLRTLFRLLTLLPCSSKSLRRRGERWGHHRSENGLLGGSKGVVVDKILLLAGWLDPVRPLDEGGNPTTYHAMATNPIAIIPTIMPLAGESDVSWDTLTIRISTPGFNAPDPHTKVGVDNLLALHIAFGVEVDQIDRSEKAEV